MINYRGPHQVKIIALSIFLTPLIVILLIVELFTGKPVSSWPFERGHE